MPDGKRRKTNSSASKRGRHSRSQASSDGSRAPRVGERKNIIWELAKSKESNDEESPKGAAFEPMLTNVATINNTQVYTSIVRTYQLNFLFPWRKGGISMRTVNAAFHLGIPVCCKKIALSLRCAEYNPQNKSHGVILRNKTPRCTIRILASGKVSLTGARSVEDTKTTAKHITKYISKLGYPEVKCTQFSIEQMHAVAMAPFPIHLEQLSSNHADCSVYEPEFFAGLVYKMPSPHTMSFRIYVSGKIIIDGGRSWDDILRGLDFIRSIVTEYRG